MKMLIGKSLCGLLLCSSVFAQDIVVRETQNINVKIGSDTYHAVYDKANGILVVTKNKGFRLGPLMPAKVKEPKDDEHGVNSGVSGQTETRTETGTNPFADLIERSNARSR